MKIQETETDKNKLKQFIYDNKALFWYIDQNKLENIGLSLIVETILNYGDFKAVKNLLEIIGIKKVLETFFESLNKKRNNYFPDVANYFSLYFKKHA